MKIILHTHTEFSYDSVLKLEDYLRKAIKLGFKAVAVTDHNTMEGSRKLSKIAKGRLIVIPACEFSTDVADIIGLFLDKPIKTKSFDKVVEEIHSQGGLVLLPHPPKVPLDKLKPFIDKIDLIEEFNARLSKSKNQLAKKFASQSTAVKVNGCDSHTLFEFGRTYMDVPDFRSLSELKAILKDGKGIKMINKRNGPLRKAVGIILDYLRYGLYRELAYKIWGKMKSYSMRLIKIRGVRKE